jgi:transposase InsO family protein
LVKGLGKIAISPDHSISNVFLIDSLDYNSLSVSQLCKMGYNCLFTDLGVTVFRRSDDSVAFKGVLEDQLYLVDFNRAELNTFLIAKTNMGWLWHRRLAHVGMKNLHKLLKAEHILGLTNVHFEKDMVCSACQAGKQVGVHHPHKNIMTTDKPLELLHMDLFGPIAYISISGSKYCLVIVDDHSRFTWVFFLKDKSQTQETLKGFLRRAQNEFVLRIKRIRSDNGSEFKNSQIEGFLEDEGIKHEFSSPYTPQQNGVVERKNQTLLDTARTIDEDMDVFPSEIPPGLPPELPPDFRVSFTFNISDLKPYMGDKDEIELRTTPIQEEEDASWASILVQTGPGTRDGVTAESDLISFLLWRPCCSSSTPRPFPSPCWSSPKFLIIKTSIAHTRMKSGIYCKNLSSNGAPSEKLCPFYGRYLKLWFSRAQIGRNRSGGYRAQGHKPPWYKQ